MFTSGQVAEFSNVFPGQTRLSYNEYLKGVPKRKLFEFAAFLIALDNNKAEAQNWREVVRKWFTPANYPTQIIAWNGFEKIEAKAQGSKVSVTYTPAILRFLDYVLSQKEEFFTNDQTFLETEKNLFEAILCFNEDEFGVFEKYADQLESSTFEEFCRKYFFIYDFPIADIVNVSLPDVAIAQVLKTIIFFDFIERNVPLKPLHEKWLEANGYDNWKSYLAEMMPIIKMVTSGEISRHHTLIIEDGDDYEQNVRRLQKICIGIDFGEPQPDFLHLRSAPLIQVSRNEFLVPYPLFLVENLFRSLYFKFKTINDSLLPELKDKDWRQTYTKQFSESHILYYLINYIFTDSFKVHFSGDYIAGLGVQGAPDYYLRRDGKVVLLENKDIFIAADIKRSANYELIEAELKKKLYFKLEKDGSQTPGAVLQIIENVKKVLIKANGFDQDYDPRMFDIYPILIVHSPVFNSVGLNAIVKRWFSYELLQLEQNGLQIDRVKNLVIVDIDFLLLYADYLKAAPENFFNLIDEFNKMAILKLKSNYDSLDQLKSDIGQTLLSYHKYVDLSTDYAYKKVERNFLGKLLADIGFNQADQ